MSRGEPGGGTQVPPERELACYLMVAWPHNGNGLSIG